ncbi:MAG: ABC transporter ATP-binding protein [Armatimonadota bacterium]|nr:ABC transporter ATP-binding protein [Armatimonadota bacterium]
MIEIRGLTKRYGDLTAVDNLWLTVERGDAVAFIGPNGAGKTTTIRMLATLLEPNAGTARVAGYDVLEEPEEVRARVGYMPDFFGMYDDMMVWEYLDFFAAAHRVPRSRRPGLIGDVLELTDLGPRRDHSVNSLSRGMKQRLCLAKTLVHDPDVLLLDEPASGLDPRARMEVRELLRELCKLEKTLLISSHILPELAGLCNKIAIIEEGELVTSGAVEDISAQLAGGKQLLIDVCERSVEACQFLTTLPAVASVVEHDSRIEAVYHGEAGQEWQVLTALVQAGFKVRGFAEEEIDLETIYVRSTRGLGADG